MLRKFFRSEKSSLFSPGRVQRLAARSPLTLHARLWCLRLLVQAGGHRRFLQADGYALPELAEALGLPPYEPLHAEPGECPTPAVIQAALAAALDATVLECAGSDYPLVLEENVARLAGVVGLSRLEQQLLCLTVLLHLEHLLEETAECFGALTVARMHHLLAELFGVPDAAVAEALRADGPLARSGLLTVDGSQVYPLRGKLDLISPRFAELVSAGPASPLDFLRGRIELAPAPTLHLADYAHLPTVTGLVLPYLRNALRRSRRGANILLYGRAGVGKTECARRLSAEVNAHLFEVAYMDEAGAPIGGTARLRAFNAAQRFLKGQPAVLVFDEVEDVFGPRPLFIEEGPRLSGAAVSKAWLNNLLESNAVPTVWITNTIDFMDPAILRRFDVVLEVSGPTPRRRLEFLQQIAGPGLAPETASAMAQVEAVTPAVITRARGVVELIHGEPDAFTEDAAYRELITESVKAQTHAPFRLKPAAGCPTFQSSFLNPSTNLDALAEGLSRTRAGRLCLYGPPGTGKSATAHWLAERVGVPVLSVRASDLLGPYVGMSERAVAAAFAQARTDGALLLVDEADSFLRERRGAERSWEVTLVNEMLTQVESFEGLLVMSTNLLDGFDEAALRRFDAKISFGFLRPEQAEAMLAQQVALLGLPGEAEGSLRTLPNLTPGDFAAVSRRHRFSAFADVASYAQAVEEECLLKKGGRRRAIGFVA